MLSITELAWVLTVGISGPLFPGTVNSQNTFLFYLFEFKLKQRAHLHYKLFFFDLITQLSVLLLFK